MHRGSMGPSHSAMGQGMPPMQNHDPMRPPSSQGMSMPQQQYAQRPPHQPAQRSASSSVMGGSWQSDKDTPHRREMIHHM